MIVRVINNSKTGKLCHLHGPSIDAGPFEGGKLSYKYKNLREGEVGRQNFKGDTCRT